MRLDLRFPWNLADRVACLHCWAFGRYDSGTGRDSLREAFIVARRCVKNREVK